MEKKITIDKKLMMQRNPSIDEKTAEIIAKYVAWLNTNGEALGEKLYENEKIEIACPICGNEAYFSLEYTQGKPYLTTVQGHCDKCNLQLLN